MSDMFTTVAVGSYDSTTDTLTFNDSLDQVAADAWAKHPKNPNRTYRVGDDGTVYDTVDRILGDITEGSVVKAHSIVYGEVRTFLDRHAACTWLVARFNRVAS